MVYKCLISFIAHLQLYDATHNSISVAAETRICCKLLNREQSSFAKESVSYERLILGIVYMLYLSLVGSPTFGLILAESLKLLCG